MSEIWNFSPSLESQVIRCVSAATKDENNKWLKEFGHIKIPLTSPENSGTKKYIDLCDSPNIEQTEHQEGTGEPLQEIQECQNSNGSELGAKNIEELVESLETECHNNIDVMVKECLKNKQTLNLLANQLSITTIEKLCSSIYERKGINQEFISNYFEIFLPTFIKREYNSITLDILVRGYKNYPIEFKILLKQLIKDLTIPNKVLQDYVLMLNEKECSSFISDLAEFDMSGEEFVNNLFAIYTAYKDCTKSERTQVYVQSMLSQYSTYCVTDRHYGRLFLAYLQSLKSTSGVKSENLNGLEKLLEAHKSPFKRPCLTLIKEMSCPVKRNDSISEDDSE